MNNSATKKKPRGLTIADVDCVDGLPRCAHCGRVLLSSSPIKIQSDAIVATCLYNDCGCWTPFRRTA